MKLYGEYDVVVSGGGTSGVAAAICVKRGIKPRQLEEDVTELQNILLKQGAILFGTR